MFKGKDNMELGKTEDNVGWKGETFLEVIKENRCVEGKDKRDNNS